MSKNNLGTLRERLAARHRMACALIGIASPELVEIAGYAGFDFVILDAEHGPLDTADISNMVRACDAVGLPAIVRVPATRKEHVSRALDAGAAGVLAPEVDSADDARALLTAARYAPLGTRGVAHYTRAYQHTRLGKYADFVEADKHVVAAVNIETPAGFADAEAILSIADVDFIVPGPFDYRMRLGGTPDAEARIERDMLALGKLAEAKGKSIAVPTGDPAGAAKFLDSGYNVLLAAMTPMVLRAAASYVEAVAATKGAR